MNKTTKKKSAGSKETEDADKSLDLVSLIRHMAELQNSQNVNSYSELVNRSVVLRKRLEQLEEYDLLLTLYNWIFDAAYQEKVNEIDKNILSDFTAVSQKAANKHLHDDLIKEAHFYIHEAEKGQPDRNKLSDLYYGLSKLLIRHDSVKLKHEVLIVILRLSPFLEHRNKFIQPYIEFTKTHLKEIAASCEADAHILYYTLAVYSRGESILNRFNYIHTAIETASTHLIPDKEAFYRMIKSDLYCDDGDFESALKEIEIVDHIIFTNQQFTDELKNVNTLAAINKFLILYYLNTNNISIIADELKNLLSKIKLYACSWHDYEARINELKYLLLVAQGKSDEATSIIKAALIMREKHSHPQLSHINLLLHELSGETNNSYWILERIHELEKTNELFYSSVWVGILKNLTKINKGK